MTTPLSFVVSGGDCLGMDVQGGDVIVGGELEMECQPDGAAREITGDVDVRVVAWVGGDDVMAGGRDSGNFGTPGSDGVDAVPLDVLVYDGGVFGELREVRLGVGLAPEVEVA